MMPYTELFIYTIFNIQIMSMYMLMSELGPDLRSSSIFKMSKPVTDGSRKNSDLIQ